MPDILSGEQWCQEDGGGMHFLIVEDKQGSVSSSSEIRYISLVSLSSLNSSHPVVRLEMLHIPVYLLVLLLLPSTQPLPAEGWETYAFNPRLLAKVFYSWEG